MSNLDTNHLQHLTESAISIDIAALNFYSWDANDENGGDNVFDLLVDNPKYRNNGTLSGGSNNALANVIRAGGWVFEGRLGVSVKPDCPRIVDGKIIKYESVRGCQQLFVPRVSIRAAMAIAAKLGIDREFDITTNTNSEDLGFWDWFLSTGLPLIITEGCKKACAVVSAGYPAIALNGVYGWGSNDRDMFGNIEVDDSGDRIKTIVPELMPFIVDREIVMAFDLDDKPKTIAYVRRALHRFATSIVDISSRVSQLKWAGSKGIDDLIVVKGVKNLDRIYNKRMPVKSVEEKSDKKPTAWQLSPKIALDVFGGTMRYDVEFKQYWEYKDGLWKQCADEYIFALVKTYLDTITEDYPTRLVTETITFARGSILVPEWIESDNTRFIPFKNGVLEVETMQLLPHSPSYGFRWQMPRDYSIVSTGWNSIDKFLKDFSNQNHELKCVLLAFCNAVLLGRSDLNKFLYLSGSGGNGKGVFMNLVKALVGFQNTHTTSLASLCENRFEPANIKNKRLVLCDDEDKKPDSLTVFKSATGSGDITCEYKGKQSANFKFGGIFIVAANQPIFRGENHEAMKRRKVDFPCRHRPSKDEIRDLMPELLPELSAFTSYILALDPDWVEKTIRFASDVEPIAELAREMSIREDSIAAYFDDRLIADPKESIGSEQLYKDYQAFCEANGLKPMSSVQFSPKLVELCRDSMGLDVSKKKRSSGQKILGLRFRTVIDEFEEKSAGVHSECMDYAPIDPLLRKECAGVHSKTPYSYTGEEKEINNNIDLNTKGMIGDLPVTHALSDLKPIPSNDSSRVQGNDTHALLHPGDRVWIAKYNENGTVEAIYRNDPPMPHGARVVRDSGKPCLVDILPDHYKLITEPNNDK
jgi:P4 family phage/plasmid primase-like protien